MTFAVVAARQCRGWYPAHFAAHFFILLLAGLISIRAAHGEVCHGTLVATALRPLPQPLVIALELRDPSDRNKELAALFTASMRSAGTKVDGAASARLHLTYSIMGGAQDRGGMGGVEHSIDDLGSVSDLGGQALPQMPSRRFARPAPTPVSGLLFLRAEISALGSERVDWVASVQCQVGAATAEDLASQMGRLIGEAAGRSVPRASF